MRADDATLDWPYLFDFGVAGSFVGFEWDDSLTEELPVYNHCSQVPAEQIVAYHTCSSARATMVFRKR